MSQEALRTSPTEPQVQKKKGEHGTRLKQRTKNYSGASNNVPRKPLHLDSLHLDD
jgi:hypothetical protein